LQITIAPTQVSCAFGTANWAAVGCGATFAVTVEPIKAPFSHPAAIAPLVGALNAVMVHSLSHCNVPVAPDVKPGVHMSSKPVPAVFDATYPVWHVGTQNSPVRLVVQDA
jgi:hypothetical protein